MGNTPQIIVLSLMIIGLLLAANLHGKPKKGDYNFWVTLTSSIITFLLLYWGGFFDKLF